MTKTIRITESPWCSVSKDLRHLLVTCYSVASFPTRRVSKGHRLNRRAVSLAHASGWDCRTRVTTVHPILATTKTIRITESPWCSVSKDLRHLLVTCYSVASFPTRRVSKGHRLNRRAASLAHASGWDCRTRVTTVHPILATTKTIRITESPWCSVSKDLRHLLVTCYSVAAFTTRRVSEGHRLNRRAVSLAHASGWDCRTRVTTVHPILAMTKTIRITKSPWCSVSKDLRHLLVTCYSVAAFTTRRVSKGHRLNRRAVSLAHALGWDSKS